MPLRASSSCPSCLRGVTLASGYSLHPARKRRASMAFAICSLLLLCPDEIVGQDRAQRFQTEAIAIVGDAAVRGQAGQLLRCLRASDFSITEDGVDQQIDGFEFVGTSDCAGPSVRTADTASIAHQVRTTPPITAIVFEELGPEARAAAWRASEIFLREGMRPDEFVGVFMIDRAVHTMVPYTRDQTALREGLRRAAMRPGCPAQVTGLIEAAAGDSGCRGGMDGDIKTKETIAGLRTVVASLSALPGRKNVLLFSEGFPVSTESDAIDRFQGLISTATHRSVTFHIIDAAGLRVINGAQAVRQRLSSYAGGMKEDGAVGAKQNANALLALDPTLALERLSGETGGEYIRDTNDIDGAVRRLGVEIRDYYRLTYRPSNQAADRRFRRIAVKVSVPGAVVRARSGYYADWERDRQAQLTPYETAPHLILDAGQRRRDFDITASVRRNVGEVDIVVIVPAAALTFATGSGQFEGGATVLARVIGRDRNVLAAASDSFVLKGPEGQLASSRNRQFQFRKTLSLKHGQTVEIVVYDILGRRASVERYVAKDIRP